MSDPSRFTKSLRLAWGLARRDLRNRHAGSFAGVAWNIGVPLVYAILNVVVFSVLMSGRVGERYGNIPFALFYLLPLTLWSFFSDVVGRSAGILREYSYLISKIAFPFWVLPLVPVASGLLNQGILLALVLGLMAHHGIAPADTAGVYLLVWMVCVTLTLGVAYAVSALAVYLPDLVQIVPIGINIVFWLTPILYPATLVEQGGGFWLRALIMDYNPFFYIVELSRHAVFGSGPVSWGALAMTGTVSVAILAGGLMIFGKLKSGFADVV